MKKELVAMLQEELADTVKELGEAGQRLTALEEGIQRGEHRKHALELLLGCYGEDINPPPPAEEVAVRPPAAAASVTPVDSGAPVSQATHKRCSMCKEYKILTEFNRNRATKDRLATYCRLCTQSSYRAFRAQPGQEITRGGEPAPPAESAGACVHFWSVAGQHGPESEAVCRKCGATTVLSNSIDEDDERRLRRQFQVA